MSCVAVSPDGELAIGGGQSGSVYIWHVSKGALVKYWSAHYKAVSCIRFTHDGSLLITGGEDAMIHVWSLLDLLDSSATSVGE